MASKNVICNALPYIIPNAGDLPSNPSAQTATPVPLEAFDLLLSSPNTDLPKNIYKPGGGFSNGFSNGFTIAVPQQLIIISFQLPNGSFVSVPATYTAVINNVPYVIYQSPANQFTVPGWYLAIWYWDVYASRQYAFYISPN